MVDLSPKVFDRPLTRLQVAAAGWRHILVLDLDVIVIAWPAGATRPG
jgi:hypothetical protein